jgi:glycosyltransferase involved in cell wall biosynthesis
MKLFIFAPEVYSFLDGFKNSSKVGGAELQQYLMIKELHKNGHDLTIYTRSVPQSPQINGLYIIGADFKSKIKKYFKLWWVLINCSPDVIYQQTPSNLGLVLALYAKLFRKKMSYFCASDAELDPSLGRKIARQFHFKLFLKLCHTIFVQNEDQINFLKKRFNKTGIIFGNLIQVNPVNPSKTTEGFLWVGRLVKSKQVELLVEIAKAMPKESFVVIAPIGETNDYTDFCLKALKSTSNISYISFVKPQDIASYYEKSKALISTSLIEGFSNTFLESWNSSTPVMSLYVDPNHIIEKSNGKLGCVYFNKQDFVDNINRDLEQNDPDYMNQYLLENHSIQGNTLKYVEIMT